jgi:hypothetical protein
LFKPHQHIVGARYHHQVFSAVLLGDFHFLQAFLGLLPAAQDRVLIGVHFSSRLSGTTWTLPASMPASMHSGQTSKARTTVSCGTSFETDLPQK